MHSAKPTKRQKISVSQVCRLVWEILAATLCIRNSINVRLKRHISEQAKLASFDRP